MHQPVDPPPSGDPDPNLPDEPGQSGLHSNPSHPAAMRCRCNRPRVRRLVLRRDGSEAMWLYCPSCDLIPPMQVNRPPKETP